MQKFVLIDQGNNTSQFGKIKGKLDFCKNIPLVILNKVPEVHIDTCAAKDFTWGQMSC